MYRYVTGKGLFLSTLSLRRATVSDNNLVINFLFLSTLSLRRATRKWEMMFDTDIDFYPRSPCGERRARALAQTTHFHFYPRSPCGERPARINVLARLMSISIHALLAESDCQIQSALSPQFAFLSTLSLRRATSDGGTWLHGLTNFYPRSPCGERLRYLISAR